MITSFLHHNLIKISIPIKASIPLFLFGWLLFFSIIPISAPENRFLAMKIHPLPKKRTFTNSTTDILQTQMGISGMTHQQKKLRRLPHVFSRVLELPLSSEADVSVEETADYLKFTVDVGEILCPDNIRAHTIEIHPGVLKVVVAESDVDVETLSLDALRLDLWRFRLPASTSPGKASAVCHGGELVVTVPKSGGEEVEVERSENGGESWGGVGRLVLVK